VTFQIYLALIGWLPVAAMMFALMPARRAAAAAVIGGWLLLPPYGISIAGLPDYGKTTAASLGVMLGTLLFAPDRILNFRPRWYDLPMAVFCLCGIASSLQNGLGIYDGLSDTLGQILTFGLPYLVGRMFFADPEGLRSFAVGMVVGGLGFVPLCLYEIRMSPVLMQYVYGTGRWQGIRLGGYRPTIFFWSGLELGIWMIGASLAGWWLWRCGALKKIGNTTFGPMLLLILVGTTILCRSTGAIALMAMGMLLLWLSDRFKTRVLMIGLIFVGPVYVAVRATNIWSGQQAVDISNAVVGPVRAQSLEYRFQCENLLAAKAIQQPVFGWGGWGRSAVRWDEESDYNQSAVATDGLWIILLGAKGFVGLTLFYLTLILPAILFVWRFPPRLWGDPRLAAGTLAAAFLCLYMVDCLLNAFPNMIYLTLAGGLISLDPEQFRAIAAPRPGIEAAGRRATATGIGMAAAAPASGRLVLAERCRTLGRSFKQERRPDEADAAWRQALEVLGALLEADPGDAGLRRRWCDCANDLAWLRANHPDPSRRDPISAVAMARRAADEFPDAAAYWNTLGVAHYRAGDDRAAADALDRARALGGGSAFDDVFLAMAHARLGDMVGARQELARAMLQAERDHPGHPELAGFCDEAHSLITGAAATADAR
jgi:tetratricopeptide (TPR) repeat protein